MAITTEFEVLSKIGQGGMGEIFKARLFNSHGFEKIVAAKKVIGAYSAENMASLLVEAKILAKLNHPNICSVVDLREYQDSLFIVMELIEGVNLSEVQATAMQNGYIFSEDFVWQLANQALRGLAHAHKFNNEQNPILHRDLSPHNIMINTVGQTKILDFGVARIENLEGTSEAISTYGKIRYCAPEILNGGVQSTSSSTLPARK
jgi:serine/threonine-protein kinase